MAETLQNRPLVALATLFGAGVLTSLTPCIYPMIPITAGLIGGTSALERSRARTVMLTLTYVLGLATFYALMGLVAGLTGSLFGSIASSWWARGLTGSLLLVFGLMMLDVIPIAAPQRVLAWAGRRGGRSLGGVFLLGATSGLVAAPCGAPAFAAVLTWVATTGSAVLGFFYVFVFSIGMTALLVVVGLFSGAAAVLPRSGAWMVWVKRAGGVILLIMGVYYYWLALVSADLLA